MNKIAAQVFEQIGFPTRKPLISYLNNLPLFFKTLFTNTKVQYDLEVQTKTRFEYALKCLFKVCADIRNDRFNTGNYTEEESAVTLLFDEVHDLVKDSKLKSIGGDEIFAYLTESLASYGVNAGYIRSVIAGSSGQLCTDVELTKIGDRYTTHYVYDPEPALVVKELRKLNYSEEECTKIINTCGTRLRILQKPLKRKINVDEFLKRTTGIMQRRYKDFFEHISTVDNKKQMVKIFDALSNNQEVDWSTVPTAVKKINSDLYTKLLYVDTDKVVQFQSQVARTVWPTIRKQSFITQELR